MSQLKKYLLIAVPVFLLVACRQVVDVKKEFVKKDSLKLKILFWPAFTETSETILFISDSVKTLQMLIRNRFPPENMKDTFWFKKIQLSDQLYYFLDSTLIRSCRRKIPDKKSTGLDGMNIEYLLIDQNDSNYITFWSPEKESNNAAYNFTKYSIDILKNAFRDSIIADYMDDVETYIDESKAKILADPKRKINRLRMKKYYMNTAPKK